ncbi:MAG: hypothetical protein EXR99_11865 [Gemmataceae bacterium]|nr:hypothetical protein [Gemmataceae bacterium]
MWSATLGLACLMSLAPNQGEKLSFEKIRQLYGVPGLPRESTVFVPGDIFSLAYDIRGVNADDEGKVNYSITTEVMFDGKLEFKQESKSLESFDSLGGGVLPGFTQLNVGLEQPAGKYTVKVTARDKKSNASASFTRDFSVVKRGFNIVQVHTTADREGRVPTAIFATGESLWMNLALVDFERNSSTKQPNIRISLEILDSNGKPTVKKGPVALINKDVPAEVSFLPFQFHVALNTPGKFTLQVKAVEQGNGKTASLSLPFEVFHAK